MDPGMKKTSLLLIAALAVVAVSGCTDDDEGPRVRGRTAPAQAAAGSAGAAAGGAPSAKIDAQQAITAATTAVPGSAREVRLDAHGGKPEYDVTVMPKSGGSLVRVEVDAMSGQVVKSGGRADRDDDDD